MQEIWKDIEGYKGIYQVSNYGRVKSLARSVDNRNGKYKVKEKIMKGSVNTFGYRQASLSMNSKKKMILIHRLVALTFIPNPEDKAVINHCDGNKLNNHVDNLEWNTYSENTQHAFDTGLNISAKGEKQGKSKLTNEEVLFIRDSNIKGIYLAKIFEVAPSQISLIKNNKTWKHI